jgi:hypothetical protein
MPIVVNLTGRCRAGAEEEPLERTRTQLKDNGFGVANLATFSLTLCCKYIA